MARWLCEKMLRKGSADGCPYAGMDCSCLYEKLEGSPPSCPYAREE